MRTILLWVWLLCVSHPSLYGITNVRFADMRSIALGGNESTQSILCNPSLLVRSNQKSIQVNAFNRYLLSELQTINCNVYYPNRLLPVGLNITSFGYDAYRESLFRMVLAKKLSATFSLGVGLQYQVVQTELYRATPSALSSDIGLLYTPVDKLSIGLLIMNLPSVSLSKRGAEHKAFTHYLFQIGFEYQLINNLLITGNLENNSEQVITGSIGLEYAPFDAFRLRAGVGKASFSPSLGVGYSISRFTVDIASIYHPVLGISSGLGIQYIF